MLRAGEVEQAEARLRPDIGVRAFGHLSETALADLRRTLLHDLSGLCAAALYERFSKTRNAAGETAEPRQNGTSLYDGFRSPI